MEIIGLIPASGIAQRLGQLPCSKEILPIYKDLNKKNRPGVLSEHLIQAFRNADIQNTYFIIRKGKWDIPNYFGDGTSHEINIGYLIMNLSFGVPFTLDQAYTFVKNKYVALGFPDIIFSPADAFQKLIEKYKSTNADIVLGAFPVKDCSKWDMLEFDEQQKLKSIVIKQNRFDLKYGWAIAFWGPKFTAYLHTFLKELLGKSTEGKITVNNETRELYIGDIVQMSMFEGYNVETVLFEEGKCIDLGTLEKLSDSLNSGIF